MFFFFSKTHTIPHQKPTPPSPPPTTPTRPTCLTTINYKKVFLSAWKTLNERTQTLLDAGSLSLLMNIYDEWKGWAVAVWQPVWMDTLCIAASARAAAVHYPPRPLGPQLKAVSCLLLPLTSVQFYCHWPRSNEARFDKFSCKECFKMVKRKKRDPNVYMKRMAKKPFPIDNWGIMFWTNPIEWSVT